MIRAIAFTSRALDVLTDAEFEAVALHELEPERTEDHVDDRLERLLRRRVA